MDRVRSGPRQVYFSCRGPIYFWRGVLVFLPQPLRSVNIWSDTDKLRKSFSSTPRHKLPYDTCWLSEMTVMTLIFMSSFAHKVSVNLKFCRCMLYSPTSSQIHMCFFLERIESLYYTQNDHILCWNLLRTLYWGRRGEAPRGIKWPRGSLHFQSGSRQVTSEVTQY